MKKSNQYTLNAHYLSFDVYTLSNNDECDEYTHLLNGGFVLWNSIE
jgi:hypothetical protein